jgi:hypothetical protein
MEIAVFAKMLLDAPDANWLRSLWVTWNRRRRSWSRVEHLKHCCQVAVSDRSTRRGVCRRPRRRKVLPLVRMISRHAKAVLVLVRGDPRPCPC